MNNNAKRITRSVASLIKDYIITAIEDTPTEKEILKGGGNNGGSIAKELMNRPIENIRISENALNLCKEHNVFFFDYFLLGTKTYFQSSITQSLSGVDFLLLVYVEASFCLISLISHLLLSFVT